MARKSKTRDKAHLVELSKTPTLAETLALMRDHKDGWDEGYEALIEGLANDIEAAVKREYVRRDEKALPCPAKKLTLDEAIAHAEKCADNTPCGRNHRQLADWLRELKTARETLAEIETTAYDSLQVLTILTENSPTPQLEQIVGKCCDALRKSAKGKKKD